jgi:hypothetical protein
MNGTHTAQAILLAVAAALVFAAALRYFRDGRRAVGATRTWILVAVIFALVSGLLELMNRGR